jgi:small GTP-binding protein
MNTFEENTVSTVTASSLTVEERLDGIEIGMTMWDTAGQERFRSLTTAYYRDADVAFICFSAQSAPEDVAKSVRLWTDLVQTHAGPSCVILFVITKADLIPSEELATRITAAERLQAEINSAGVFVTSAKSGLGIPELFAATAKFHPMFTAKPDTLTTPPPAQLSPKTETEGKGCC